jgi:hypothetical protein
MSDALLGSSVSISMTSVKPLREGLNAAVAGRGALICVVKGPGSVTWISRVGNS